MKQKNIIYVIVAIVAVAMSIASLGIFYSVYKDVTDDKIINDWEELLNSNEKTVIYFGRNGCTWCAKFKPVLEAIKDEYGVKYTYIDIEATKDVDQLLAKIGVDYQNFATPYTAVVKKNKKLSELFGYNDAKKTFDFFKSNGLIEKDAEYKELVINEAEIIIESEKENYPNLSILTYKEYEELLEKEGKIILIVGQTTCGYCTQYKPILNEIAKEENLIINYIDITSLTNDEYASFQESLNFFKENKGWGTPLTLIIEEKHVIDYKQGSRSKKDTLTYYRSLGLL